MFSCRNFRACGGSRAPRNAPILDQCIYSREFASIRGLNSSPPTRTSFVDEPSLLFTMLLISNSVGSSGCRFSSRRSGHNISHRLANSTSLHSFTTSGRVQMEPVVGLLQFSENWNHKRWGITKGGRDSQKVAGTGESQKVAESQKVNHKRWQEPIPLKLAYSVHDIFVCRYHVLPRRKMNRQRNHQSHKSRLS